MKKQLLLTTLVLFLSVCSTVSRAQEDPETWPKKTTFGLGAGMNMNLATGEYTLPSEPNNIYSSGFGIGPSLWLMLELPIGSYWMIGPRVSYNDRSGTMNDGTDPSHKDLPYTANQVGLDINFKYSFSHFHVLFGPSVSSTLSKTYTDQAGAKHDLPGAPTPFFGVGAGVGYDIPLNKKSTVWLTPEIFYHQGLTNLGGDSRLAVNTIRAGMSMKFDVSGKKDEPPTPAVKPELTISAKGILPSGEITAEPIIPEQVIRTRTSMPLLPYVFYDYNSDAIPARYNTSSAATGFSIETLQGKAEDEVNHQVLNVVGARLKQYPNATINLTGTNSNSGDERNNIQLSKKRALAVREYLVNSWGIDGSRIVVDQRNLPELPTNPVTKAGMEENRRVEIGSEDDRITEPVKIENRKSETIGETMVRFETNVRNADKVSLTNWKITLDKNGTTLGSPLTGSGMPPHFTTMSVPGASAYANQQVHYTLEVKDVAGNTHTADGMTRIVPKTVDRDDLEKYAMLSFDFDRSEINNRAQKMISLISESINREANAVSVRGYCDNTGTDDYNQALSEARAASAAKALRSVTSLPANVQIAGNGERAPKFINDLPEGRMLNRRVEVDIQKSSR